MFRKLNDEVGDLRLFDFQKSYVDSMLIRKLNYFLIEHFKEFIDVKYIEEMFDFSTYIEFKERVQNKTVNRDFEQFKQWVRDYNNLNALIEISELYSNVLMLAVMQTYPIRPINPCRWIKSKFFRRDVAVEKCIGIEPKETIKKAENIVKLLEAREKLITDIRLLLASLKVNQKITLENLMIFNKKDLKKINCSKFHTKTKKDIDIKDAIEKSIEAYLEVYNRNSVSRSFNHRVLFLGKGVFHITDTPNDDEIDDWIEYIKHSVNEGAWYIPRESKDNKGKYDNLNVAFYENLSNVLTK